MFTIFLQYMLSRTFSNRLRLPASLLSVRPYSQFKETPEISSSELDGVKKQILWRARQRGLLELDVIVGSFADKNLKTMTPKETEDFEKILSLESPDLYKLLSGQIPPSAELRENTVLKQIMLHVFAHREKASEA